VKHRSPSKLFRKLSGIGWQERAALLRATGLLVVARLALRALPLRKVLAWASPPADRSTPPQERGLQRLIWAVDVVGWRLFPRNPCLTQAIAVQRLLRRRGYPAELRIGVRKGEDASLDAHAWVESGGEVVIGGRGLADDHIPLPPILPGESSKDPHLDR
jgi:hypothetical protein